MGVDMAVGMAVGMAVADSMVAHILPVTSVVVTAAKDSILVPPSWVFSSCLPYDTITRTELANRLFMRRLRLELFNTLRPIIRIEGSS
jgi:hypothetical protein